MKKIILYFLVLVFMNSYGQVTSISEKEFEKIAAQIEEICYKDINAAYKLAKKLIDTSKKKSQIQIALANKEMALVKIIQSQPDDAFLYNDKSYKINLALKNNKEIAKNLNQFGTIYQNKSDFFNATKYFLKSIAICEKEKLYKLQQHNLRSLANIAMQQQKNDECLKYINQAIGIEKLHPNEIDKADNLFIYAVINTINAKITVAEKTFDDVISIYKKNNDFFKVAATIAQKSILYADSDPIKTVAMEYEANEYFQKSAPKHLMAIANYGNLGGSYFTIAKNDSLLNAIRNSKIPKTQKILLSQSESIFLKCLTVSKTLKAPIYIMYFQDELANIYKHTKQFDKAMAYLEDKKILNDSLFSQKNKNAIAKLESEKEVLQLKSANEKKSTLNKILIGSSIGLLLLGFLGYRNLRIKRKLQNQKISELEKDKQLLSIDAMLKGQEEERSRIAKDLHDGLGGLLSGTKLSFTNMKENLLLTPENAIQFEKSLSMLDATIADLRKVAHNLMPEALVKFGFNDALNDFCSSIQLASNITVDYQKIGLD